MSHLLFRKIWLPISVAVCALSFATCRTTPVDESTTESAAPAKCTQATMLTCKPGTRMTTEGCQQVPGVKPFRRCAPITGSGGSSTHSDCKPMKHCPAGMHTTPDGCSQSAAGGFLNERCVAGTIDEKNPKTCPSMVGLRCVPGTHLTTQGCQQPTGSGMPRGQCVKD